MKKIALFCIAVILTFSVFSQDLIVTNDGDSINCNITKVKHDKIYFTFKHDEEFRSTLLLTSGIKVHIFDYYPESNIPEGKIIGHENFQHLRLAVNGGFSNRIARISDDVPDILVDYLKNLNRGYHFGADISYFISEPIGFGIKTCFFKTSNSINNIGFDVEDGLGTTVNGQISDDITISFIAPSFTTRFYNGDKSNAFYSCFAIGYVGYKNNSVYYDSFKITGNTVGLSLDIGYDIGLSDNLSLGFQVSLITGTLIEMQVDNGKHKETVKLEKGEYENLSRIDFSVGLRFNK